MRATGEVLGGMIKVWLPSPFPTLLSQILQWGASSPSAEVRFGLCQTLYTAGICPKLYQCLGYSLGLVVVGGSVPIDSTGFLGFTFLIHVCEVVGGVQVLPWPEQMNKAPGVMVWEERNFLPLWLGTLLSRVGFGPEDGKAVGRWRDNGTQCV